MKRILRNTLWVYLVVMIVVEASLLISHFRIGVIRSPSDFLTLAIKDFEIAALWPILIVAVALNMVGLLTIE